MKRLLSVLLLFGILSALLLPVGAMESQYEVAFDPNEAEILDSWGMIDRIAKGISQPAKRAGRALEDNLAFPGSLTEKSAFVVGAGEATLSLGTIQTGKPNQYYCVAVYAGKEPKGDPVYMDYGMFKTEPGFTTTIIRWMNPSVPAGQYTLVSFTAELSGQTLYPVENTASMTDIYFCKEPIARKDVFIMDWETKERLEPVRLSMGETAVLAIGRSPLPSYGQGSIEIGSDMAHIDEAGGICFVTPRKCGTGVISLLVYGDYDPREFPIEVCVGSEGHKVTQRVTAGTPTEIHAGCTLLVCEHCGAVKREYSPTLDAAFGEFKDLPTNAWYYDLVKAAVYRKLFNGVSRTAFSPNGAMTRAMLVTVLWRYEGEPAASDGAFLDVPSDVWYAQAVNWAAEQGIVNGTGSGRFTPNGTVTREQLTTILYRYGQRKAVDMSITGQIHDFPDGGQVSVWAEDAMAWALGQALVSGVGKADGTYLMPLGNATRAQVSAILIRFITSMLEPEPEIGYPDTSTAVESGSFEGENGASGIWAFYESGLLQIGGTGGTPGASRYRNVPWAAYKEQITEVEILYGIDAIYSGSFREHKNLRSVKMADSVTKIYDEAFAKCTALETVKLSERLYMIGEYGFSHCEALKELTLPESVTDLGGYCFEACSSLEELRISEELRTISTGCFRDCTALKELRIPEAVLDYVGQGAFRGCTSLEKVTLPMAMRELSKETFFDCVALKEIQLPYTLEKMGEGALANCASLEAVALPPFLTSMYMGTFTGCTALKDLYVFCEDPRIWDVDTNFAACDYDELPFGSVDNTVVWGYVGSPVQKTAEKYGYEFRDITELF